MTTTRTKQLGKLLSTATVGGTTIYVTPAGFRTIVKSLYVQSNRGTPTLCQVSVGLQEPGVVIFRASLEISVPHRWDGWLVLNAGDQINVYTDGSDVNLVVSGTELLLD